MNFLATVTPIDIGGTVSTVLDQVVGLVPLTAVIGVIVAIVTVCLGYHFSWWGIRKAITTILKAIKGGKVSA